MYCGSSSFNRSLVFAEIGSRTPGGCQSPPMLKSLIVGSTPPPPCLEIQTADCIFTAPFLVSSVVRSTS